MKYDEIIYFARQQEPVSDILGRNAYPCAAELRDGLVLPCVLFREMAAAVDDAKSRANELLAQPPSANAGFDPWKGFVTWRSAIVVHEIRKVMPSPNALSFALRRQIIGEASMSFTAFAAVMRDGRRFFFATGYEGIFFEMPDGYAACDIDRIEPYGPGRRQNFLIDAGEARLYKDRPYFQCFVELVEFGDYSPSNRKASL